MSFEGSAYTVLDRWGGVGCARGAPRMTPKTSVQATKRVDCHVLQQEGQGRNVPSHPLPPTHPLYTPFPGPVQTGVWAPVPGQGKRGQPVLCTRAEEGRGAGVSAGGRPLPTPPPSSRLGGATGPASTKRLLLSRRGETQTEVLWLEGSPLGFEQSLWPQLRLNKSVHNTSSPTTCLPKEHKHKLSL